jgi:hypothetical protein
MSKKTRVSAAMRWHSKVGVGLFWLLIVLSATGIALNHTDRLGLAKTILNHPTLLSWYGLEAQPRPSATVHNQRYELRSHAVAGQWVGQIYREAQPLTHCTPPLLGSTQLSNQLGLLLCGQELIVVTADGELFDTWTSLDGLPSGLVALDNSAGQAIGLHSDGRRWLLDIDLFTATAIASAQPLPEPQQIADAAGISLQTLLLDLHSGRLFGALGIWIVDIAGVLFSLLAVTGLWSFLRRPR